jgi:hypothetical protein
MTGESGLYSSGWTPRGSRRSWRRLQVTIEGAQKLLDALELHGWGGKRPLEAVAWFEARRLRILVVDYDDGARAIVRVRKRDILTEFGQTWRFTATASELKGAA